MRRRVPQLLIVLVALALVVSAAGCGSKKSDTTTTSAAATTTTTDSTTTETTDTTATTEATTTDGATTTTSTTTSGDTSGLTGDCAKFVTFASGLGQALSGSGDIKAEAAALKTAAANAPAAVQPDFQVLSDDIGKIADTMGDLKPGQTPDAATEAKLAQLSSTFDTAALTKATQDIAAWAAGGCK